MRIVAALTLALALAVPAGAVAQQQELRVYNWSDYIDPDLIPEFEAATGIRVIYDVYDNNEILETKLLAGRSGYDIVVPTTNFLVRQIAAGVIAEIDKTKIPNLANLDPALMERAAAYDPGNAHGFIYMWGTTLLAWNVDKVKERVPDAPLGSWRMLFDPAVVSKLADCGVYMLDTPDEGIPAALNFLGLDPNSTAQADLDKAAGLLRSIRPYIRKFHSSENINALANGDICLAHIYSGDAGIAQARAEEAGNGVRIEYAIPEEGAVIWFDMMVMPKDAPNKENAYKFMSFVLEPANMARITNTVTYPNAVPASLELVDEAIRGNPNTYPPAEIMAKLYAKKPYDQRTQRTVTRLWTSITTGG
jgi:putrescine transport system substrate-binding protein